MKPTSQFTRKPLKGLWHKHFLVVTLSSMAHNILNELGKNGTKQAAEKAFDQSRGKKIFRKILRDFVNQIIEVPIQTRSDKARLTGEWLIYAKTQGSSYYLCIASHKHGQENTDEIYRRAIEDGLLR